MAPTLDAWRADFPALAQRPHGARLAYLDSASTTLKPQAVIDAVAEVARAQAGNVHRAVHALAEAATVAYDAARDELAALIGAPVVLVENIRNYYDILQRNAPPFAPTSASAANLKRLVLDVEEKRKAYVKRASAARAIGQNRNPEEESVLRLPTIGND